MQVVREIITASKAHGRKMLVPMLIMASALSLNAQTKFSATTNAKQVAVGQKFKVVFTLDNAINGKLSAPAFNDFNVDGPMTGTSTNWVNGNISQAQTWTYYLSAKKEGSYTIGRATVTVGGQKLTSNEITITVTAASQQTQNQSSAETSTAQTIKPEELSQHVLVRAIADKNRVYLGEQVNVTIKVYYDVSVYNLQAENNPQFKGFWKQDLDMPQGEQIETYNGKQYHTQVLGSYALFPQTVGKLEVNALSFKSQVQYYTVKKQFDIWSGSYVNARVPVKVPYDFKSPAISINVKPLPPNAPSDFNGLVGNFTLEALPDKTELTTDESISYKIKIAGSGNLMAIDDPTLKLPETFEVYDPNVKDKIGAAGGRVSGFKEYEWLIVPLAPGEYKMKPYAFSYFNPQSGEYASLSSEELIFKISGEAHKKDGNLLGSNVDKQDVELLGKDIRYIKTKSDLTVAGQSIAYSTAWWALYASPLALLGLLIVVKRKRDSSTTDIQGTRARLAVKLAQQKLAAASGFMRQNKPSEFLKELNHALLGYAADKLSIPRAQLSKENVAQKLAGAGVNEKDCDQMILLLSEAEMALYAPLAQGRNMQSLYDDATKLIIELEQKLRPV